MNKKLTLAEVKGKAEVMPLEEAVTWLCGLIPDYGISVAKLADIYSRRLQQFRDEKKRLEAMSRYEIHARCSGFIHIGGVDEAGRGPLAGPVAAACVILPDGCMIEKLNDSKKLSPHARDRLFDIIRAEAVDYGVAMIMPKEIDRINILNATKRAMMESISKLRIRPDYLIIDAVELPVEIEQLSIFKADSLSVSVAAASILAKVTRDRWMEEAHKMYPEYGFDRHKGYGTDEHIEAIRKNGLCPLHRRSFTRQWTDDAI